MSILQEKYESKYFDIVKNEVGNYLAMHKDPSKAIHRTLLSGEEELVPFAWSNRKSVLNSVLNYIEDNFPEWCDKSLFDYDGEGLARDFGIHSYNKKQLDEYESKRKSMNEDYQLKNISISFDDLEESIYNIMQSIGGDIDDFAIVDQYDYIQIGYDSGFDNPPKDLYGDLKKALEKWFGKDCVRLIQYRRKTDVPVPEIIEYSIYVELNKDFMNIKTEDFLMEDLLDRYFTTSEDVISGMLDNASDEDIGRDIKLFNRINRYLKTKNCIIYIDSEALYDPEYYSDIVIQGNISKYFNDYHADKIDFVAENLNGNTYLYFRDEADANTYLNMIDEYND